MPEQAKATWAAHRIIAGPEVSVVCPIAVRLAEDRRSVRVFLPVASGASVLGYFLVKAKVRLPRESLEFRMSMSRWFRTPNLEQLRQAEKAYGMGPGSLKGLIADLDRFREISRLVPETKAGASGIFLEMSVEDVMRSYIVYDFLPNGGAMVMDGGFWDTYDLPSFVESALSAANAGNKGRMAKLGKDEKSAPRFSIGEISVQDEPTGGKTFRVPVAGVPGDSYEMRKLRARARVWMRTPEGNLVSDRAGGWAAWEDEKQDWADGPEMIEVIWDGPPEGSGNTYAGLTVDLTYDGRLKCSGAEGDRSISTEWLYTEAYESRDWEMPGYPQSVFGVAYGMLSEVEKAAPDEDQKSKLARVRKALAILKRIEARCPSWEPEFVRRTKARAEKLLAGLAEE